MGKKILFIEDEPDQVKVIRTRLEANGYEVISANDGLSGLELAKKESPDLVLLDIIMPGIDGVEVCKRLRSDEQTKDLPVIAVTASGERTLEERCYEVGCNNVIRKPYDSTVLMESIEQIIKQSNMD